ncbi:uncharacterized protein LOC111086845 [Limulus polyphemus]|uniref:Uncharacterized protein LOC111086845 n=1 Tax=Limulus polyphemus TaxID=6850 RepID=A0ABM1STY4_LIMPO|nr:uncharacterized protein LOC111086845 [Limulus polyphemus]
MLNHVPNAVLDNHLDTKGGYPDDLSSCKINGCTHPLMSSSRNVLQIPWNSEVHITENPQCVTGVTDDCLPVPKNRVRYRSSDKKASEGWTEIGDHVSATPPLLHECGDNNQKQSQASTQSAAEGVSHQNSITKPLCEVQATSSLSHASLSPANFPWDSSVQT